MSEPERGAGEPVPDQLAAALRAQAAAGYGALPEAPDDPSVAAQPAAEVPEAPQMPGAPQVQPEPQVQPVVPVAAARRPIRAWVVVLIALLLGTAAGALAGVISTL